MNTKTEAGFTVVEIVVALLVLMVGLLAMTWTSGLVIRMAADAFRSTTVAESAVSRVEILRSRGDCIGRSGRDSARHSDLRWESIAVGEVLRVRVVSTWFRAGRSARMDTVETILPCW